MKFHITPNDACYCGSGKKYKYCCRDNPKPNADFLKDYYVHWQRGGRIDDQVQHFFIEMGTEFAKGIADLWWENPFLEEEEIANFLHEFSEEEFARSMQTLFRLFFFGKTDELFNLAGPKTPQGSLKEFVYGDLDAEAIRYAQQIAATSFDFFQILAAHPETCLLEMRRLSDGHAITVVDRAMARHAQAGLIIGARALPYRDNICVLETPVEFVIPASRLSMIRPMLEWWHKELFGKKPFDYSRALNDSPLTGLFITVAIFYDDAHPTLTNSSGELTVFVKGDFSIRDPQAVRETLSAFKDISAIDGGKGETQFVWMDKSRTVLGNLTLSQTGLRLETNSKERFKKFETRLKKIPGVKLRKKTEETIDAAMNQGAEVEQLTPRTAQDIPITPEIRMVIHEHLREHYKTWPDEKLPALEGRSARELVRTAKGREQVTLLLTEMQERQRKIPETDPMHGFSLKFLADELGLKMPASYWD